ncbi:HAD family hydrolase [Metabacillus idriensis]|uniref:HAD family hydrolase n=1 Tax=Metabacillus idriensis TaxID=324768 RepID=UPI003D2E5E16
MIKVVIFDLDGTLLNRDESIKVFIHKQYERLNKWVNHTTKEKYTKRFIELDNRGYVWKDKVYQQLKEELEITGVTWEDLLQDYISQFKNNCIPFQNLFEMLEELRNKDFILGMITNGIGQFQMDNIKALGIEKYFQTILISEWEGLKKPDPNIFLRALKQLDVPPNQSVYVGDHPENDVQAAQNVGMKAIWKKDIHWKHFTPSLMIDDLGELPLIISNVSENNKVYR